MLARGLIALALACAGCNAFGGPCDLEPDLTGRWLLAFTPIDGDGGLSEIPRAAGVTADWIQKDAGGPLDIGRRIWGTFTSADPTFFGAINIPQLMHDGGEKSGAALGCTLKIKVPLTADVHDNAMPQPPNRLFLSGLVVAKGKLVGDTSSTVILMNDVNAPAPPERHFAWTGARP